MATALRHHLTLYPNFKSNLLIQIHNICENERKKETNDKCAPVMTFSLAIQLQMQLNMAKSSEMQRLPAIAAYLTTSQANKACMHMHNHACFFHFIVSARVCDEKLDLILSPLSTIGETFVSLLQSTYTRPSRQHCDI